MNELSLLFNFFSLSPLLFFLLSLASRYAQNALSLWRFTGSREKERKRKLICSNIVLYLKRAALALYLTCTRYSFVWMLSVQRKFISTLLFPFIMINFRSIKKKQLWNSFNFRGWVGCDYHFLFIYTNTSSIVIGKN